MGGKVGQHPEHDWRSKYTVSDKCSMESGGMDCTMIIKPDYECN